MRRYLLRLLGFSLILGALPTVFIGMTSYWIASRDIERKVNESHMQLLLQTEMRVEQTLRSLEKSATQFAGSSLVKRALGEALTSADFMEVRNLTSELGNLQSNDAVITQVHLINLEKRWAVNLSSLKPLDALEEKDEFAAYAEQPAGMSWRTGARAVAGAPGAAADTVSLIQKIPLLPQTSTPKGLLVAQISAADLRAALAPEQPFGRNYILDRTGTDFLSAEAEQSGYAEVNRTIAERVARDGPKPGFFNADVGQSRVGVSYRSSAYNGWTYVSVVSIAKITKETKKIGVVTMAVCALILLLALAFAFYGSRRMYRPIRSLIDFASSIETRSSSGTDAPRRDELEFIRESMKSLAAVRSEMESQMQGQAGHLKEFFVLKLFTGQMTEEDYLYRSGLYGFPESWGSLAVLTVQIDNLQETRFQEQDRELLLFAVGNIVEELLPPPTRFTPILLNTSQVTLLALPSGTCSEWRDECSRVAGLIRCKAWEVLHIRVSIGISRPFPSLSGTVKAYGESMAALHTRISLGPDIIVHYEDVEQHPSAERNVYTHLKVMEEQLVQSLRELQLERAGELFRVYLDAVLSKEGYAKEHHLLLLQLISRLLGIVQDQGVPVNKVLGGEAAVERFLRLRTREEIVLWFQSRMFAPIVRILSENAESRQMNIADKLVGLIQEKYDQDITLEGCAASLHFHPVYLSRVFKKEIGVSFSEYLSDYRMNRAREMLESTDMRVSEIGEKLQYKNISAFIRSFRKGFGVTPGQYREQRVQR